MKTIVALLDFSDLTFKVLKTTHSVARAFGSQVILLHVIAKEAVVVDVGLVSPTVMQEPTRQRIGDDEAKLLELRDSLAKFGVDATVRQIQATEVDQVLEEVRKLEGDLIVVGSHGHGAFYNLVVGSVTEHVVRNASCPVMVVPAGAAEEAA